MHPCEARQAVEDAAPPTQRLRIAAIVLNYKTPELALGCVESLVAELDPRVDRIVVVDNKSDDGSAQRIRDGAAARGWKIQLIESTRNGGFAAGNNLGIRAVDAQAYLLINSDARLLPGAIAELWRGLEEDPRAALVGPRIEGPDGEPQMSCSRFPTPVSELLEAARTGPLDRVLSPFVVPLDPDRSPRHPDWIPFAAVLIRREALLGIGPLDEGFFLYFEDIEWCRRARDKGWRVLHQPAARVVHMHGQSTGLPDLEQKRARRPRYWYAARSRYFRGAWGQAGLLAANALRTVGMGLAWVREALGTKRPHAAEGELVDIWRS
jgi:N-acetylglucosaminyl-diphospho-decaprenol L-rhamnosyltransferase